MLSFLWVQVPTVTMAQLQGHFGYQNVQIVKTSSLGIGSYGAVYKALCDELSCAAKIIHPTLFTTNDPGGQKIMARFEQECQFLSGVRHPNIVQYLGVSSDPESGLPVLLMELMDSSLTKLLERSEEPLPLHIQVDICNDIALALAYLHSNGIIHRDLSSNNVLLIGPGYRAKVTDFGMSKLTDANLRLTPMTMCPGTLAYMPPEALDDSPAYTNKLDCFSFGVLDIQIVTRKFPEPSQRFKTVKTDDPQFPTGQIKVPVPEIERRQPHINLIDPAHPLLPVALNCLKDGDRERPSAKELCHCLAALKKAPQYDESVQQEQRATAGGEIQRIRELQAEVQEKKGEMEQLQEQNVQQTERFWQQIREKNNLIKTSERQIRQQMHQMKIYQRRLQEKDVGNLQAKAQERQRELEQLQQQHTQQIENFQQEKRQIIETTERQLQEKDQTIATKERQLQQLNQQLKANEQDFQRKHLESEKKIRDLEQSLLAKDQQEKRQIIETTERQLQEKDHTIATKERQLQQLNQQLKASEQDFQRKHLESEKINRDLEQSLLAMDQQIRELQQLTNNQQTVKHQVGDQSAREGPLSLHWSKCGAAPCKMRKPSSVVNGNVAYINPFGSNDVYSYDSRKQTWSRLPQCPHRHSSLAVVKGLLTAIGGELGRNVTNQLFSLTGESKWVEHFPPMTTKRCGTAVVCSGKSLVAAGGYGEDHIPLDTVEVLDTETQQWSTASSLPFVLVYASATICQDRIYLLGYDTSNELRSVLACSKVNLLQSCQSQSLGATLNNLTLQAIWFRVADLPVRSSSCGTLCGQLLAVGGSDNSFQKRTTAIYQYTSATNSWEVISHMPTARSHTLVTVLPGNKLMVVGGRVGFSTTTDAVEIATLQE